MRKLKQKKKKEKRKKPRGFSSLFCFEQLLQRVASPLCLQERLSSQDHISWAPSGLCKHHLPSLSSSPTHVHTAPSLCELPHLPWFSALLMISDSALHYSLATTFVDSVFLKNHNEFNTLNCFMTFKRKNEFHQDWFHHIPLVSRSPVDFPAKELVSWRHICLVFKVLPPKPRITFTWNEGHSRTLHSLLRPETTQLTHN